MAKKIFQLVIKAFICIAAMTIMMPSSLAFATTITPADMGSASSANADMGVWVDANDNNTGEPDKAGDASTDTNDVISGTWSVTIPDQCALSPAEETTKNQPGTYIGTANISYKGDIGTAQTLSVIPDATFALHDNNGWSADVNATATVATEGALTELSYDTVKATGNADVNISANLDAGKWSGTENFTIYLNGKESTPWLRFTSTDDKDFTISITDGVMNGTLSYAISTASTTPDTFTNWEGNGATAITVPADSYIYVRNSDANDQIISYDTDNDEIHNFVLGGDSTEVSCDGDIMAMMDYEVLDDCKLATNGFQYMFSGCETLTAAPTLPATTLASFCYCDMFFGCSALTVAPALPAKEAADECYLGMFWNCTSLAIAPALPATTLADGCYCFMFANCTSLAIAPALPATTLATACYNGMFAYTLLVSAPELPATTLATACYNEMFAGCVSLTSAPELPATILAKGCYESMFAGCSSLSLAPELPATTLSERCYYGMFGECTSLISAPALPSLILTEKCYSFMFAECSSLKSAPELPATTLSTACYYEMFEDCTSLVSAPELPATTLATRCYSGMFENCTSLISAPSHLNASILSEDCYIWMFLGCVSLVNGPEIAATTFGGSCCQQMFYGCTSFEVSTNNTGGYAWTCPDTSGVNLPVASMFKESGGDFTDDPVTGTTYYWKTAA